MLLAGGRGMCVVSVLFFLRYLLEIKIDVVLAKIAVFNILVFLWDGMNSWFLYEFKV